MNQSLINIMVSHFPCDTDGNLYATKEIVEEYTKAIAKHLYTSVVASILITDVVMEHIDQKPTAEDYIRGIKKDFGEYNEN